MDSGMVGMAASTAPVTPAAISLSQYQQMLGDTIRMNRNLHGTWITAELSDVRVAGGHCYMELIEKDERTGTMLAKMRAMIWASALYALRSKFYAATGRDIQSGLKVMVRGSATHHNVYGLSLTISDIDPTYTMGDLERQRREILERHRKEGKLDLNHKKYLPATPQRIAVISAAGAAGYGDFMQHLENSPEGFVFYPLLFPAVMQGERTAESVLGALDKVEQTLDLWDCVVIIRGGGSTTDMHGFDNYELAERVATFPLPVVVGIGHERDRNVLDEIACVRCKTPTAVADFLVNRLREAYTHVIDLTRMIVKYAGERMQGESMRLSNLENLLPARVQAGVMKGERRIMELAHRMEAAASRRVRVEETRAMELAHRMQVAASHRVNVEETRIMELIHRMQGGASRCVMGEEARLSRFAIRMEAALKSVTERPAMKLRNFENMLRVLSPANTLRRGFSITKVNGKAVYNAASLKPGDVIETIYAQGSTLSEIKNCNPTQA